MVELPLGGGRVYCDACIWIYAVEGIAPYTDQIRRLFAAADGGSTTLLTSELTLLEVLVKPFQAGEEGLQHVFEEVLYQSAG